MRRAEGALTGEDFEGARDAMEEAIANLRDGAEALAKAERAKAQAAQGRGGQPMRDPLGRPVGETSGQDVDVPEKSEAQRARELLEELRRRLSDGERNEEEIDYLERLLERF
jgi:succinate dehydrogenase/fumarate reductase flavoprotein subunit